METVLPCTLRQKPIGAVVMPNLLDPITSFEKAMAYRKKINALIPEDSDFSPCMTLYLTDETKPEDVVTGFKSGLWQAVKLYMADKNGQGGTTGSHQAVRDLHGRYKVFEVMEKHGIPLLGHFEAVEKEVDEFDREVVSMARDLQPLLRSFPGLNVVVEHVTDGRMAEFVAKVDHPIFATVTAHHLMINRNSMFWEGMNPLHYCKPVPKREVHRKKVREYVTSGNPRFGAGTDSAPHDEKFKTRCCGCAAGIFTAEIAVEMYTTAFDEDDGMEYFGAFLSENFLGIYGMKVSSELMTVERTPMQIPKKIGNIRVFNGGATLPWKLVT